MSDDLDFDMEVVGDDELDEIDADGVSSSEESFRSNVGKPGEEKVDSRTARISKEEIPEDWEAVQLGDNTHFQRFSGDTPTVGNPEYWGGGILWLSNSEVEDGEINIVDQTERSLTPTGLDECTAETIPPRSVILSCTASIGKVAINTVEMATNQQFNSFKPTGEVNAYYLANQFLCKKPELETIGGATTHNHLPVYMLDKVGVPKPSLPEQRKIASVLYAVDQAIQKTEAIIEQAKRVKRGLMQRLFHHGLEETNDYQTTKYGSAPAHWEIKPISDLAIQVQAGGTPDTDREEFYDGKIPWIRTGELRQKRIRDPEKSITEAGFENSTVRLFPKNTVLVAMYGATAGESAMLDVEATSNQACCGVITDEEKILPEFLFQQLLYLKENLIALGAGSGQQNISKGIISNFRVLVPQLEEQTEIASILRIWDEEVEAGEKKREQLKRLKKGLMQDLLTGEVRTADKAIDVLDEVVEHG